MELRKSHQILAREVRSPGSSLLPGVTVNLPGLLPELLVLSNTLRVASRKTWGREKPDLGGCVSTTPSRWVRSFLPCPPCSLNTSWYCRLSRAALSAASLEGDPGPESHTPRNDSRFFTLLVVGVPGGGSWLEELEEQEEQDELEDEVKEARCVWSQQQLCRRWLTNSTSPTCDESTLITNVHLRYISSHVSIHGLIPQ